MKTYNQNYKETAFLLGGIGTGNISLGTDGKLRDWEIFNSQGKNNWLPGTFFSIWVRTKGEEAITKILGSKQIPPFSYNDRDVFTFGRTNGLPHFDSSKLYSEYPFVWVDLFDKKIPIEVTLEAFTPFIPLNADDSGIPVVSLKYKVKNISKKDIEVSLAGSLANAVGFDGYDRVGCRLKTITKRSINDFVKKGKLKGIFMSAEDIDQQDLKFGNMYIATTDEKVSYKSEWLEGGFFDGLQEFWDDFSFDGVISNKIREFKNISHIKIGNPKIGSICISKKIKPGEEQLFEFLISWYFPNRPNNWEVDEYFNKSSLKIIKNYYSTKFNSSIDVTEYVIGDIGRLESDSRKFARALHSSTLPDYVIDALSSNIAVLRSPTCFRLEDGTFLGWEGSRDKVGFCPGTCTHVWNYAQTVAFLFPELEMTARKVEFGLEIDNKGKMNFRTIKPFGRKIHPNPFWNDLPAAADGQLGTIIRLYREWKLSGDSEFIKSLWPKVKLSLEYCIREWDTDEDYVLDGSKHNTYDIEFYGPEPLSNIIYLGALKVTAIMAEYLRDDKAKERYESIFKKASKKIDSTLWNGEYYIQRLEDIDKYPYQFGNGCLSDQLFGQLLAHIVGLGHLLPEQHIKKAIYSIFKNNFKQDFLNHFVHRTFALNDEDGLINCSWPNGGRPRFPFAYAGEVWPGIEYQVATHLIFEDYIEEGLKVAKAVRDRHDGIKRNPWDEGENTHHYARSMSSWGLLIALSGFKFDMVEGKISFDPKINQDDFLCFFSTGKGWGIYRQKKDDKTGKIKKDIEVLYGDPGKIKLVESV